MIEQLVSDNPNVVIGFGTYASSMPVLRTHHENNKIFIGKYCSIAHNVTIFAGGNHPINYVSTHPLKFFFSHANYNYSSWSEECGDSNDVTEIGNDVWIADGATILSGVKIGDGAIIGARAVVASNVPAYAIVAGNPAKILKFRFSLHEIEKLKKISWWNWSNEKIKKNLDFICSSDLKSFFSENEVLSMISYAQNFEDIILWRALNSVKNGFYIDVGASYPIDGSVTKLFYENGWSGINIEPNLELFDSLQKERPRDINLNVAISSSSSTVEFFVAEDCGWSTIDKDSANELFDKNAVVEVRKVQSLSLNDVCSSYCNRDINFLKIDVEGAEGDVLKSISLDKYRPWIIIVEATKPRTQIDASIKWESMLLDNEYFFAYFDGLNKFYVAKEHDYLIPIISVPPNVFDGFVLHKQYELEQIVSEAEAKANEAEAKANEAEAKANEAEAKANEALALYSSIINSRSWKITKPFRLFNNYLKKLGLNK